MYLQLASVDKPKNAWNPYWVESVDIFELNDYIIIY
jgi:hypothetical protein